jgi:hypothetical protein
MNATRRTVPDLMASYFDTVARIEDTDSFDHVEELAALCNENLALIRLVIYQGGGGETFVDDIDAIKSAKDEVCDELQRRVCALFDCFADDVRVLMATIGKTADEFEHLAPVVEVVN